MAFIRLIKLFLLVATALGVNQYIEQDNAEDNRVQKIFKEMGRQKKKKGKEYLSQKLEAVLENLRNIHQVENEKQQVQQAEKEKKSNE